MTKQPTQQSKITKRQMEILHLLYRFRYLNRLQIQTLLNHKNHRRIHPWLNTLTELKFIIRSFDKKLAASSAVYSLDTGGRKYLRDNTKREDINRAVLAKGWRDKKYSHKFQEHCLFLADIYFSLLEFCAEGQSVLKFHTKNDLYGMEGIISPGPDAYFSIKDSDGGIIRYFLEIFDDVPSVALRKRVKQYLAYYESDEWQDSTNTDFPVIVLICPNNKAKGHLYYFIKNKLGEDKEPVFYLAIKDDVLSKGLCKETLKKVIVDD